MGASIARVASARRSGWSPASSSFSRRSTRAENDLADLERTHAERLGGLDRLLIARHGFDSQGALGFAALLAGGPMATGKLAEWKHTVCDDCANVDSVHKQDGIEGCHGESVNVCKWHAGPARIYPDGPPWPGCRGFILRDGAPGPVKRAHEAAQKNYDAALATHKARQEKP